MSYEWSFDLRELPEGIVEIEAEWEQFVPTYRGREDKEAAKFDPKSVYEYVQSHKLALRRPLTPKHDRLSFMCRSNFDQQSGDFSLEIVGVGIVLGAKISRWSALWQWLSRSISSLANWWRGDRGLRLLREV